MNIRFITLLLFHYSNFSFANFCTCTHTLWPDENAKFVILYEVEKVEDISVSFGQIVNFDKNEDLINFLETYPYLIEDIERHINKNNSSIFKRYFNFSDTNKEITFDLIVNFFKNNYSDKEMYKSSLITYCISNVNGNQTDFKVSSILYKNKDNCCRGINKAPEVNYYGLATGMELNGVFDWDLTNLLWSRTFNGNGYDSLIYSGYFKSLKNITCNSAGECF